MPRSFLVVLRTCHLMPINLRFIFEYTHKKRDFFSVHFYQIVFCQFLYALSFWMFYRNERFMISHIYFAFVDTVIPIKFNALNSFECHGMKVIYSFAFLRTNGFQKFLWLWEITSTFSLGKFFSFAFLCVPTMGGNWFSILLNYLTQFIFAIFRLFNDPINLVFD